MSPDCYFTRQGARRCGGRGESTPHQEGGECDLEEGPSTQEEKTESLPLPDPSAMQGGAIKCP